MKLARRPRRNRQLAGVREMVQETHLDASKLVWPIFITEGRGLSQEIESMPGVYRYSLDVALREIGAAQDLGIGAVAIFPKIEKDLKDPEGREALNPNGLIAKSLRQIKAEFPHLALIADVALDPFTSHGHDGLVKEGVILNDETVEVLIQMALLQAEAGADYVAPSDMMDGRVGAIRKHLDQAGLSHTGIISYSAKYASAFYGPFRNAVGSRLEFGDKKTYQMNPANAREALLEASLDVHEGADILLVKPALPYLDVIFRLSQRFPLPIAAYNVSGEYTMIKAAVQKGWLDERAAVLELLLSLRRAGADLIFTYHARDAANWLV